MRRAHQPAGRGTLDRLAAATHCVLGALLIIIVVLGVLDVFAHAFPLFNTLRFPKLGGTEFMQRINAWHGLVANLVAAIACFHGCAALFHHYVLRDDVLMRMWPGLRGARRHDG
jgi:cytochrome b561